MNVAALIVDSVRRYGDRIAVEELRGSTDRYAEVVRTASYAELGADVFRLCSALRRAGIERGDRVAVLLDNSVEMIVSEWACLCGGYLWVALNTRSSAQELAAILADSAPSLLLVGGGYGELARAAGPPSACRLIEVGGPAGAWRALLETGDEREVPEPPQAEQPVRIRYTSGTAGLPKGAVLPRRSYDASVEAVADAIGPLREDDVVLQVAPMTHASGAMLLPHVAVGAKAILVPRFDAAELIDLVETRGVTSTFLVPTMLIRVVERLERRTGGPPMPSLRTIVYGGASMPVDRLVTAVELLGPVLVQIYGLTESTWPVASLPREDHLRRDGEDEASWHARLHSCGRPTGVGALRVVGEGGDDAAPGSVGEIRVRGRNTMLGYWRKGAAARDGDGSEKGLDEDGWMRTGDLGVVDDQGYVTIVDRLHDMIVSGGFNVYPREVEGALSSHPAVFESAVVGRPSEQWGETVHAYVVLRPHTSAGAEELQAHCATKIAGYKKPRSIEIVAALPKNASGKVLRRELRNRLRQP